jgi:hypothetical protein
MIVTRIKRIVRIIIIRSMRILRWMESRVSIGSNTLYISPNKNIPPTLVMVII